MGSRNYRKEGHKLKEKAVASVFKNTITNEKIVETVRKLQAHLQRKVDLRADDKLIYQVLRKDLTADAQKVDHFITESYIQKHVLSKINTVEESLANGLSTDQILKNVNIEPELVSAIEETRYSGSQEQWADTNTVINDIDREIEKQIESGTKAIDRLSIKRKMLTIQDDLSLPVHSPQELEAIFAKVETCLNTNCNESRRIKFLANKFQKANKTLIQKRVNDILEQNPAMEVEQIVKEVKAKVSGLKEALITEIATKKITEMQEYNQKKSQEKLKIEHELKKALASHDLKEIVLLKASSVFFDKCFGNDSLRQIEEIIKDYKDDGTNICLNYANLSVPSCVAKKGMVEFCNDVYVKDYLELSGQTFSLEDFAAIND